MAIELDDVREVAMSFPNVEEGWSAGTPTFYARRKRFLARLHESGDQLVLKVGKLEMEFLLEAEPDVYHTTEHYYRWEEVLIQMAAISPAAFRRDFEKAWRRLAQKRDVTTYDGAQARETSVDGEGIDFATVREIALSFPGVEEGTSFGTPAFRVNKKFVARLREDGDLVLKVGEMETEFLIDAEPETYYITDHYRGWGSVLIRLGKISAATFEHNFETAWRQHASKQHRAAYEARLST